MKQGRPQHLTEADLAGWHEAADQRPRYKPQKQENLRRYLRLRNPWRWRRLQSDAAWARKQLAKAGHDPEEFRWLV